MLAKLGPHAAVVAASVALGFDLGLLAEAVLGTAKQLWFTGTASFWVSSHALRPHTAIAWQSAILFGGAIAWLAGRPASRTTPARAAWSVLAALLGLVLVLEVVHRPTLYELGLHETDFDAPSPIPWGFVAAFGAGVAAASWLARRAAPAPRPIARSLIGARRVLAALAVATAVQAPSIADFVDAHEPQSFPRFRLELAAARPARAHAPEVAWSGGAWWSVDREDALVITDAELERARWIEDPDRGRPGISLRFDPPTAAAVRDRSLRRLGEFDALVVDGVVQMVPNVQSQLLDGELALYVAPADRGDLAELYARLTGRAPPLP